MRSEQIKTGVERTPNRSLLYALGYTDEELSRPLIGVVSSYNEIVPGHMGLDKIAEAVKAGIRAAGGTPVMFPAIAVCDGIAMGHVGMKYSLVTRDLIADSTEAMVMAHQFDGLVMIPNCDKNVPGLLMAAARLNIPTIFCSGGPMLAGRLKDGRRTCLSHMFEAVGAYHAGKLDEAGMADYTENACPTCGSCSGMYTANSMNCLTEAIGMALRGNGTIPAVYSARLRLAKQTGMKIMELVEKNVRPRDIMTEAAFHNAETVDMALGCSTNTMLHLPAIAHEAGVSIDLTEANHISANTPNLCHLAPAGDTFMEDLCQSQGVSLRVCYESSFCLSSDVTAAYDPNFADAYEKKNAAFVNYGVGICKYTGARGKSGSSDANAETVAYVRAVLDGAGVRWQICELGKIDAGGGGTVAQYMANRNIATLDAGVPVLSMHAPFEVVAKVDCYEMYRACKALYEAR